jgi:hypothetical protein
MRETNQTSNPTTKGNTMTTATAQLFTLATEFDESLNELDAITTDHDHGGLAAHVTDTAVVVIHAETPEHATVTLTDRAGVCHGTASFTGNIQLVAIQVASAIANYTIAAEIEGI